MLLIKPPQGSIEFGLRAMKTVALAGSGLGQLERALIGAAQEHVLESSFDIDALSTITPEELAKAIPVDAPLRAQLVQALIVLTLADGEAQAEQVAAVERFAEALSVSEPALKNIRQLVSERLLSLRFDVARRSFSGQKLREAWAEEGLTGIWKVAGAMFKLKGEDPELAAKYQALGDLPEGSLGRSFFEFTRKNGFAFPGEKDGVPERFIFHDLSHVLGGYDTDPAGEMRVLAFSAGYRSEDPFSVILFAILQVHMGVQLTPISNAERGYFDPPSFLKELKRGAAMNVDLSKGWDPWAVMREPVAELRRRYNIEPS
jgi:tellurite resistance protein